MEMTFVILSVPLLIMLCIVGLPVAFAMAFVGIINSVILTSPSMAFKYTALVSYSGISVYAISIVPLFIFMGNLVFYTGLGKDAYTVAKQWVGHLRGGLAQATTIASAIYAATTGHSMAAAASMAKVAIPEMREAGYHDQISAACIAAAGTFAMMIPPSVGLVFYAISTVQPVGKMLLAGYVPGIFTALTYVITIWIIVKLNPSLAGKIDRVSLKERLIGVKNIWGVVLLIAIVLYCLYSGIITPTEVGATGCLIVCILGFVSRKLNWKKLGLCVVESAKLSGSLMGILVGALIYSGSITRAGIPRFLGEWIGSLPIHSSIVVMVALAILLVLGCFMSPTPIIFIMAPILMPIMKEIGIHPILFGIIFIKTIEIGAVTPPYGVTLFAMQATVPDLKYKHLIKGVIPFIIADLLVIACLFAFPVIALYLPETSY